jgi:hypothetical protein
MDRVLIGTNTSLGKEIVYSFKVAMGVHLLPENIHILKINPLFHGNKEFVVKQMHNSEKNILDAWYFNDELGSNDTVLEPGLRSGKASQLANLPNCQLTAHMYQLDVGSVYVYPDQIDIKEAQQLKLP